MIYIINLIHRKQKHQPLLIHQKLHLYSFIITIIRVDVVDFDQNLKQIYEQNKNKNKFKIYSSKTVKNVGHILHTNEAQSSDVKIRNAFV